MSNQLATRSMTLKDLLDKPAIKSRFESVLRTNANSFVASILTAASNNPKIAECDPMSVISAALTIASLGLSLSPTLGQAGIAPFGRKATPMIQRKGLVQLALRTNQYRYIHVTPIYEGEVWEVNRLTGQVKLTGQKKSSNVVGYCAYFQLFSGYEKYLPMSVEEIMEHAKKYSRSFDRKAGQFYKDSAWDTHFEKMCEKTVLRMLLLNWGPMSAEMQTAIEVENETGEVAPQAYDIDAEVIESETQVQEPEQVKASAVERQATLLDELGYGV